MIRRLLREWRSRRRAQYEARQLAEWRTFLAEQHRKAHPFAAGGIIRSREGSLVEDFFENVATPPEYLIPLDPARRARSAAILAEASRRLDKGEPLWPGEAL